MIEIINKQIEQYLKQSHTVKKGLYLGSNRVNVDGVVYNCKTLNTPLEVNIGGTTYNVEKKIEGSVLVAFINSNPNEGVILGVIE